MQKKFTLNVLSLNHMNFNISNTPAKTLPYQFISVS